MHWLSRWVLRTFFSVGGLLALGFLDSSIFFSFPFAIDLAVILLSARQPDRVWLYPVLATIGSVAGAAATFWIGRKIGDAGLDRFVSPRRMKTVKKKAQEMGAVAMAAFDLVPPPFPYTPLILAAGALDASAPRYLAALTIVKLIRFGGEGLLAMVYGRQIVQWLRSDVLRDIGGAFIILMLAGTAYSIYKIATYQEQPERSRT